MPAAGAALPAPQPALSRFSMLSSPQIAPPLVNPPPSALPLAPKCRPSGPELLAPSRGAIWSPLGGNAETLPSSAPDLWGLLSCRAPACPEPGTATGTACRAPARRGGFETGQSGETGLEAGKDALPGGERHAWAPEAAVTPTRPLRASKETVRRHTPSSSSAGQGGRRCCPVPPAVRGSAPGEVLGADCSHTTR